MRVEVPAEEAPERVRRQPADGAGQLLGRLAGVALAIGVEVPVVDLGGSLDEHHRRIGQAAPGRIGEQQRDERVRARVVGLLRIAEPGGDVDARIARPVIRRDGPGDRLAGAVDGGQLGRDEPVEHRLDFGWKRCRHGASISVTRLAGKHDPGGLALSPRPAAAPGGPRARARASSSASADSNTDSCSRCLIVGNTRNSSPRSRRLERAGGRVPASVDDLAAVDLGLRARRQRRRGRTTCRSGS